METSRMITPKYEKYDAILINLPSSDSYVSNLYSRSIPPIGLGYIAHYAKKKGFNIGVLDGEFLKINYDQISELIIKSESRIIGINCYTSGYNICVRIIEKIQPFVDTIVIGGPHATAQPYSFYRFDKVITVQGFGERLFVKILENQFVSKIVSDFNLGEDILNISLPESMFRNTISEINGYHEASLISSRGCPYNCGYCLSANTKYMLRELPSTVSEIKDRINEGANSIHFLDDIIFPSNKLIKNFTNICMENKIYDLFHWRGLLSINALSRLDPFLLFHSGCRSISIGMESGSNRLLKLVGKNYTNQYAYEVFKKFENSNINFKLFFMIGLPTETEEDIELSKKFISLVKGIECIKEINIFQFKPYPGTFLYKKFFDKINVTFSLEDMRERANSKNHLINMALAKETHFCEHELLNNDLDYYKDTILEMYNLFFN